jgi:hypothetical protein
VLFIDLHAKIFTFNGSVRLRHPSCLYSPPILTKDTIWTLHSTVVTIHTTCLTSYKRGYVRIKNNVARSRDRCRGNVTTRSALLSYMPL